jgi:hypothetical protein
MTIAPVTITTEEMEYRAIPDESVRRIAFVTGAVVDEATGVGVSEARLRVDRNGAAARVTAGGFFAVSGATESLFPDLATTAYSLDLHFAALHYKAKALTIPIPAATSFPIPAGVVRLRPEPVRIEGRVTRESNRLQIAGANVEVTAPANVLLLRAPSYMNHALVNVTPVTMLAAGPLRSLSSGAAAGSRVLTLNNVAGLGNGSILRIGNPPASEYAVLDGADAPTSTATLRHALWHSYPQFANAQAVTAMPAGPAVAVARNTDAGEALLVLAAPLVAAIVEITDGPDSEYHDTNLVADGDAFFGADGIAGVPSLTLRASAGGFLPLNRDVPLDPTRPVIDVSFRLKT